MWGLKCDPLWDPDVMTCQLNIASDDTLLSAHEMLATERRAHWRNMLAPFEVDAFIERRFPKGEIKAAQGLGEIAMCPVRQAAQDGQ